MIDSFAIKLKNCIDKREIHGLEIKKVCIGYEDEDFICGDVTVLIVYSLYQRRSVSYCTRLEEGRLYQEDAIEMITRGFVPQVEYMEKRALEKEYHGNESGKVES